MFVNANLHRLRAAPPKRFARLLTMPAVAVSALIAGVLLAGCFGAQPDETPDAETTAAAQTIAKARAEAGVQDQRVKDAEDLTATPTP